MSESLKKYLIRSLGYVTGPYSKPEIEELINDGTISINDEVIGPFSVAFYLQDHSEFKSLIQSLSAKNHIINRLANFGRKISVVTGVTAKNNLGDTPEPDDLAKAEDADFQLVAEDPSKKEGSSKYKSITESKKINREKISLIKKRVWQLIIVCFLLVSGFIFLNEVIYPLKRKKALLNKIQQEGMALYSAKNYEESFKLFKKGLVEDVLGVAEKKVLLKLLIQRREVEQSELLLREIESSLSQSERSLIKGLIAFFESSYPLAEKYFSEVKGESEEIGLMNLILLKWVQKDYQGVLNKADEMILKGYERGVIFYLKNFSLIKIGDKKNKIKNLIENSLKNSPEYRQELTLLLAYLYIEEGQNSIKIQELVMNLLDWDFDFHKEYNYGSLTPINILGWSSLFPYCEKIFQSDKESSLLTALYGVCNLKIGSYDKGFQYIEKSKNQDPQNDLLNSIFAYSLMKKGSLIKAEVFINQISNSTYRLPYILKARFFENQKEWDFALKYWEELLKIDPYNLSAIGGLALSNYKIKNHVDMKMYKDRGLALYPYYMSLLSLP